MGTHVPVDLLETIEIRYGTRAMITLVTQEALNPTTPNPRTGTSSSSSSSPMTEVAIVTGGSKVRRPHRHYQGRGYP